MSPVRVWEEPPNSIRILAGSQVFLFKIMSIPILIPARNEASNIEQTLARIPRGAEPIVIPNGCTDRTEELARQSGAQVLVSDMEGKMPALQAGIRHLGERATEPFVVMDADTRPLFPRMWLKSLIESTKGIPNDKPAIVNGPIMFSNANPAVLAWRNIGLWKFMLRNKCNPGQGVSGANMLLCLRKAETVERVLDLPHYWPREDAAIRDTVLEANGHSTKAFDIRSIALTSADRFVDMRTRIFAGREYCIKMMRQSYLDEAAPGSRPYELHNL